MRLVIVATLMASLLPAAEALACSIFDPGPYRPAGDPDDEVAPGVPVIREVSITRAEPESSCELLGSMSISIQAADERTARAELGYRLTLVDGELPKQLELPDGPVAVSVGDDTRILLFWDDEGFADSFEFSLAFAAVDAAGNVGPASEPITISDPGTAGCRAGGPVSGSGALAVVALALIGRLRRRR